MSGSVGQTGSRRLGAQLEETTEPQRSWSALDAYVEKQMRRLRIPGAAVAIVEGDRVVHQRGFGHARPGGPAPTAQTPFLIGSLTKSFTALAVMQLAEAGAIELDAAVTRYLPWFRLADPQASSRITVRHLLNQTSGLSSLAGTISLAVVSDDSEGLERQARALSTLTPNHAPGETHQYCNLNYDLLGLVLEAVSGKSYSEYVEEHILEPLGMIHTTTSRAVAQENGLAAGHRYWFGIPIPTPETSAPGYSLPAGGLISTAEDMACYLITHLNGGRTGRFAGGARFLSEAGFAELHRGVAHQMVLGRQVETYAMGWAVQPVGGVMLLSHGGNVPTFSAFMGLLPEHRKGVVLLVNADHGLPFILAEVGVGLAALLAEQQPPPIRLGFLPWVFRLLPLLPLVQIVSGVVTVRRHRRRRSAGDLLAGPGPWVRRAAALIPDLALAVGPARLRSSGLLGFLHLYMPDLAWVARLTGVIAGATVLLRVTDIADTRRGCAGTPSSPRKAGLAP